jgi:GGDEF domain-containing protein
MPLLRKLLLPMGHPPLSEHRRATLIVSRVRMVASVFAVLTPTWILVDYLIYDWPLWGLLGALRITASACFFLIAVVSKPTIEIQRARKLLWALMLVPILFFLASNPIMAQFEIHGVAEAVSMGYVFLPFVIMAGLSIFPITALEGLLFAVPVMGVMFGVAQVNESIIPFNSYLGAIWLLALIAGVSTFAGMSQLHFLCQLVRQSSLDGLTEIYNRGAGVELLRVHFTAAQKSGKPLALVFLDLDNFKSINDRYGHEEGDNVLRQAAEQMRQTMRRSDILIRWGGEEFVIAMPATTHEQALAPMQRLLDRGLGSRPGRAPPDRQHGARGVAAGRLRRLGQTGGAGGPADVPRQAIRQEPSGHRPGGGVAARGRGDGG